MPGMKKGIALLITVLFVMAITVAVGVGLKQVKVASKQVQNENFMLQSSTVLDDVLTILHSSKELKQLATNKSSAELFTFLSSASFIPLESSGLKVLIQISSARSKFNVNSLVDTNGSTINVNRVNILKDYLRKYRVNGGYVDILLDAMSGVKQDMTYYSAIFNEKPYLFRDYIVSQKHLGEVNDFYTKTYHDNNLKNIDFRNLFYFSKDKNTFIDLNYATMEVWQMMLGSDKQKAEQLASGGGEYTSLEDLSLSDEEKLALAKFKTSYFEPFLEVVVNITQNSQNAKISFEYDIQTKKESNFVYEI
jgi:hypothetical protein